MMMILTTCLHYKIFRMFLGRLRALFRGLRIFVFMDLAAPSNSPVKIPAKQRRILLARELCRILPDQPDTGG